MIGKVVRWGQLLLLVVRDPFIPAVRYWGQKMIGEVVPLGQLLLEIQSLIIND